MFRRYAIAMLALAAVACGDDDKEPADNTPDNNGTPDAGGAAPVIPGRVTNVGDGCTAATECTGATGGGAQCLKTQTLGPTGGSITFKDGYCSAQCTNNSECTGTGGSAGECPFSGLISNPLASSFSALLAPLSVCLKPCGSDADCRGEGYKCAKVADQFTAALGATGGGLSGIIGGLLPPGTYCLSTDITIPDAGMPAPMDSGTPANDSGAEDGGSLDGAVDSDAGTPDAGGDAGASDAGDAGSDAA